jgi:hypothetical protein
LLIETGPASFSINNQKSTISNFVSQKLISPTPIPAAATFPFPNVA